MATVLLKFILLNIVHVSNFLLYEVCKLSDETCNVAFVLAKLVGRGLEDWQRDTLSAYNANFNSLDLFGCV